MASDRLNVIGLISGGKDSFYSLLYCIEHGHRLVALANLYPAVEDGALPIETQLIDPEAPIESFDEQTGEETDLNSFMYQTVGHEVIPLYAAATGLPLYRRQIHGSAVRHERDYDYAAIASDSAEGGEETESMLPLLRTVMEKHPEANAVCAGAILSTYQRTRVESVAIRLGLTPLAFLWKYPILPSQVAMSDEAQLLKDMDVAQLDARIIKVASAGLDEDHLWLKASSYQGAERVKRALRKFGAAQGAALGEGGEFETLVVDGPEPLFQRRICVKDADRGIVREGGGTSWVKINRATIEDKAADQAKASVIVRQPDLFDARFQAILKNLTSRDALGPVSTERSADKPNLPLSITFQQHEQMITKTFLPQESARGELVRDQTSDIVRRIHEYLQAQDFDSSRILNTIIVLRSMADFPVVNAEYSKLFSRANPPSRVTISCGSMLPEGIDISLALNAQNILTERRGLHVQSRSYWAPANIGPYSQGITSSLANESDVKSITVTSIAGQIPLIPATMALPVPSEENLQVQVTLSLQHLWRIGFDMRIQFWSSAVAYFARAESHTEMQRRARLAGHAWQQANAPPADEEDDDDQLDPWDLKHNSEFMTLGDVAEQGPSTIPDWSVLPLRQQNEWKPCIPPVFSAEVESLPRSAEVEWHAHAGVGGSPDGSIQMFSLGSMTNPKHETWCMLAKDSDAAFAHTTVSYECEEHAVEESANAILESLSATYSESLQFMKIDGETIAKTPYLIYLDSTYCNASDFILGDSAGGMAVVPCHSLLAADGSKRSAIALYRTIFHA